MNQLLVNVFCPPVSKSYDFWIPDKMKVEMVISRLCDDISGFESNSQLFVNREGLLLCSYMEGKALQPGHTLEQLGIKSGDKLMLV